MAKPAEDWFNLKLPAQPDLEDWLKDNVQELEDPGRFDEDPEQRYEIELFADGGLHLYGTGENGTYQSVAYPELVRRYVAKFSPTKLIQFQVSVTYEDDGDRVYLWLITAVATRAISAYELEGATRFKHFRRFFREKCCVVCEQDVLSEGGRHDNTCPLGKLFGVEGEMWRPLFEDPSK